MIIKSDVKIMLFHVAFQLHRFYDYPCRLFDVFCTILCVMIASLFVQ